MNTLKFYLFLIVSFSLIILNGCHKEKKQEIKPELETSTVTDVSGNSYKTIKIGNQWWMAENLKVTVSNDSSLITEILGTKHDDTLWSNINNGAYSISASKIPSNLYNWYAVNDIKKMAPKGWHIPTDEEWKILEVQLGMSQEVADRTNWRGTNEADKLVSNNENIWQLGDASVLVPNNLSGFSEEKIFCRLFNSPQGELASYWWSASISSAKPDEAWYRYVNDSHKTIFRYHTYKNYGFAVRCVKD